MGAWINFSNVINIGSKTTSNGVINTLSYKDIDKNKIQEIVNNNKIEVLQIESNLPKKAFNVIDKVLKLRPDISFRVFNIMGDNTFDLDDLSNMKYLTKLKLDGHLVNNPKAIEIEKVCNLSNIKELSVNLFDLKDYSFIKNLNSNLDSITIIADTMRGTPLFDCKWLLPYRNLKNVFLGKKAMKNLKKINELPNLNRLILRGIKIDDFYFLENTNIESLSILWCSVNDLNSIEVLKKLKYLELWRIPKLEDISIIEKIESLKSLKLQDLKHLQVLPDFSSMDNLKDISIINTPIDKSKIPSKIKILK